MRFWKRTVLCWAILSQHKNIPRETGICFFSSGTTLRIFVLDIEPPTTKTHKLTSGSTWHLCEASSNHDRLIIVGKNGVKPPPYIERTMRLTARTMRLTAMKSKSSTTTVLSQSIVFKAFVFGFSSVKHCLRSVSLYRVHLLEHYKLTQCIHRATFRVRRQ